MSGTRRGPAEVRANMTPMIDVTFLLIVFFVLVSQIVEAESVEMDLPKLADPATSMAGDEQRVVVNVVPGSGDEAIEYRIGAQRVSAGVHASSELERQFVDILSAQPSLRVNLRADARTRYDQIHPVIEALSAASRRAAAAAGRPVTPRLQLVIVPDGGGALP